MNDDTGFLFIPEHVMEMEDLSLQEKCVYGRIIGLTKKEGYCYATNEQLGRKLGLSADRISHYISVLIKKKLIMSIVKKTRKENGNPQEWGTRREIYAFLPQTPNGVGENAERGVGENAEYSNTQDSITSIGENPIVKTKEDFRREIENDPPSESIEEYTQNKAKRKAAFPSKGFGFNKGSAKNTMGYNKPKKGSVTYGIDP